MIRVKLMLPDDVNRTLDMKSLATAKQKLVQLKITVWQTLTETLLKMTTDGVKRMARHLGSQNDAMDKLIWAPLQYLSLLESC